MKEQFKQEVIDGREFDTRGIAEFHSHQQTIFLSPIPKLK